MADNVVLPGIDRVVAADDCDGALVQRVKVVGGVDGVLGKGLAIDANGAVPVTVAAPLPVTVEQLEGCGTQGSSGDGNARSLSDILDPLCPDSVPLRVAPADISSPGQRDAASSFPVTLATEQVEDKMLFAAWPVGVASLGKNALQQDGAWTDVSRYRSVSVQTRCDGAATVTFVFEGSNDGVNPVPLWMFDGANVMGFPLTTIAQAASTIRFWVGALPFRFFRFRMSVAPAVAGVSVYTRLSMAPFAATVSGGANLRIANADAIVGGPSGVLAVGGNNAPGIVSTGNPLVAGGVDADNKVRRVLTDTPGNQTMVGPDGRQFPATLNPVPVASQRWDLLFSQILNELRTLNLAVALMANGQPVPETLSDDLMQSSDSATVTQ